MILFLINLSKFGSTNNNVKCEHTLFFKNGSTRKIKKLKRWNHKEGIKVLHSLISIQN